MGLLSRIFGTALVAASSAPAATPAAPESTFAARLHGPLSASSPGNLVYAPANLRLALAMAAAGAHGETAVQMQKVLELSSGAPETFRMQLQAWQRLGTEENGTQLRVASRLWAAQGASFRKPFLDTLREAYGAPLDPLDFAHQPEPSRATINHWVAQATGDRVRELVPPRAVSPATKLILTSAIYLKAAWREPFPAVRTKPAPFQLASGPVSVPLMHQVDFFPLAQTEDCQVLELPYRDGRLAMDVILPRSPAAFARVEQAFVHGALPGWLRGLTSTRVDVTLPRFKVSMAAELSLALQALGMTDAFELGKADFSGMDGTRLMLISQVLHQAFVEVDEVGTEAAAASAVVMLEGAAFRPEKPVSFRADHPFLFVIRDTEQPEPLFVGRIADPR